MGDDVSPFTNYGMGTLLEELRQELMNLRWQKA